MTTPNRTVHPMASTASQPTDCRNSSSLRLCGARTRQGGECRHVAMANGRCRFHGGLSTGPRTAEGIERHRRAVTIHGARSQEATDYRRAIRKLRADARRLIELA